MPKKVKLILTLDIDDNLILDEFMIKRAIGQLGEVLSYDVSDYKEGGGKNRTMKFKKIKINQISEFINEANKIYFGSLSIENRKDVALAILYISNLHN